MSTRDRLMVALGLKAPPPPDPEKVRVLARLDRLEGRVRVVEEWQKVEDAVRGRAKA